MQNRDASEAEPLELHSQAEPGNEVNRDASEAEPLELHSQAEPGNEVLLPEGNFYAEAELGNEVLLSERGRREQ
ncbi:MAG: hypothetical protein ACM65K_17525 [Microcoleus sp.]